MMRVTFASLFAHKRRLIGMFLSVFLGVAFLTGTLVIGDTLDKNFASLFGEANAGTDVVVRPVSDIETDFDAQRGAVDASVADDIAEVDGVAAAVPYVEGFGQILGADGEALGGNGPPQLAGSWIDDPALNPYRIAEGRAPETPDEVVINRGAAKDGDLHVGATTIVSTPEPHEVTIVGLATFGDEDGIGPVTMAFFTLDAAQEFVAHAADRVTSVRVRAEGDVSEADLAARVSDALPDDMEAVTGTDETAQQLSDLEADFLDAFKTFLVVFAVIALLVAAFSIHNTFSILVAQRTRESALLRTIGASRRQVLASTAFEAVTLGVVASVAGILGGIGLAQLLKAMLDAFGFALPAGGTAFATSTAVVAFVVGVVVTLVAGAAPAWKAARVAPLAVLRDTHVDRTHASLVRAVAGAVLLAGGIAVVLAAVASDASIGAGALGALATMVGIAVFAPVVARPASKVIGAPLPRLRGITGSLARRNAMRNPRRTAGTATALMVGVGVVTLFTVFAASIKASIDDTVAGSVDGELVITAGNFGGGGLSPQLADAIATSPTVDHTLAIGTGAALVDGHSEQVQVLDVGDAPGAFRVDVTDGALSDVTAGNLAVSRSVADDEDWDVGTKVPVTYADGAREDLTVSAVYEESVLAGNYMLPRETWAAHTSQVIDQTVLIDLTDGVTVEEGRRSVEQIGQPYGEPDVLTRAEFVDESASNVDMMLGLVYVLLALAIVIALMGIANTLALAVHERTSELGILRAVGTTRPQVRSMVRWEAVIVAAFGTLAGVAVGVFLGWGLFNVAGIMGFDTVALPASQLGVIVVIGAIAGVLAGIRPARRAARLDVLQAIATT
jgi:putative ABC transport system permease protein